MSTIHQHHKQGLSLRHPFLPATEEEKALLIRGFACRACIQADAGFFADAGLVQSRSFLLFNEVLKVCSCGFHNRLFIVINDLYKTRSEGVMSSAHALKLATEKGLLEEAGLHEGFFEFMLAAFLGDGVHALALAEEMVLDFRDNSRVWYNLAWFFGELGRFREALAAYEMAHSLEPEFAEAWYNKGLMCARLGMYSEAESCMERAISLRPDLRDEDFSHAELLAKEEGRFGTASVVRAGNVYKLLINDQEQGGAFLEPEARAFYSEVGEGPGPLPLCFYNTAWLLPALLHPSGDALMLGLGSGSGAVAMLHHFPNLHLDVVEADTAVVALARRFFPLVAYFEQRGRLVIHLEDAQDMCAARDKTYAFLVMDLYVGGDRFAVALTPELLARLGRLSSAIWINLVGRREEPYLRQIIDDFGAAGLPIRFLAGNDGDSTSSQAKTNWIAASETVDADRIRDFIPFEGLDPSLEAVSQTRRDFRRLQMSAFL